MRKSARSVVLLLEKFYFAWLTKQGSRARVSSYNLIMPNFERNLSLENSRREQRTKRLNCELFTKLLWPRLVAFKAFESSCRLPSAQLFSVDYTQVKLNTWKQIVFVFSRLGFKPICSVLVTNAVNWFSGRLWNSKQTWLEKKFVKNFQTSPYSDVQDEELPRVPNKLKRKLLLTREMSDITAIGVSSLNSNLNLHETSHRLLLVLFLHFNS